MKKLTTLVISGALLLGAVACTDNAQTSANAPDSTEQVGQTPVTDEAEANQGDATSETRKNQLEADIRAREERNNITGGDADRADGDLESEVRSKLEANLPASQLTVDAKDGVVTISGTVPTQPQYERIDSLAREIKGVKDVMINAEVAPAEPEAPDQNNQNQ